ncbi:hypothetical protein [Kordia sp.]|uniref:hypothetical protein n=1 Tax=Kordia sp. TaxID=1965332 RepID=UPI0025C2864C|nr:hypothetical protein [Kordia sp.]MCH2195679.1 hypothetical protein [Kordia sp.]
MKKSKKKLEISKKTVANLENIKGGRSVTSYSCPGDQCPTEKGKSCENGPCEKTIQDQ